MSVPLVLQMHGGHPNVNTNNQYSIVKEQELSRQVSPVHATASTSIAAAGVAKPVMEACPVKTVCIWWHSNVCLAILGVFVCNLVLIDFSTA